MAFLGISNYFGIIGIIITVIGLMLTVIQKRKEKEKSTAVKISQNISEDAKLELIGMIRAYKKLSFNEASKTMGISELALKKILYKLVGSGEIAGTMDEKSFTLESGVDDFIKALDNSFKGWQQKEQYKEGKVDNI